MCSDAPSTTLLCTHSAQHSLLHAADQGWAEVVVTHLAAHADGDAKNVSSSTALGLATAKQHEVCMALLQMHGAKCLFVYSA